MSSNDRFLNPYNFVRYLPEGRKDDKPEIKLLGRCAPPPHDRFVGITGRMKCELEAVTPIFISDSEFVEDKGNEHKSYRFFRLRNEKGEEEFAIPSTSLRGMLRSVFEAATNSCFSVFEERRLTYRDVQKARAMKPAIVRSLPKDISTGKMEICESARIPFHLLEQGNWKCGEEAYATLGRASKVIQISKNPLNNSKMGWVKITGRNIPNKKNEYFFYPMNNKVEIEFNKDRMDDYNKVLQEQIISGFSTEYQTQTLEVGNLVYVEVGQNKVINIALVKVPRLLYRNSIVDLLPNYLHPCSDYNSLCPACRLFGWVYPHPNPPKDLKIVAYAGRVKTSHAQIIENKGTLQQFPFPLAILSAPKPTTTFFYLLNKDGKPDFSITYDTSGAQLRGRKFYRHQTEAKEQEYERAGNVKDDQNRTIRDALKPGATFDFTVEFENLAPVEFGALVWSIEMEDGLFHKLGLGKPFGFGSIKLHIKNINVLDVKERYDSFANNGLKAINDQKKTEWIRLFKEAMKNKYKKDFENLDNIRDIKAILSTPALPVHYPRTSEIPEPEGKNFEWFMKNKRFGKMLLKVAPEDTAGFPLKFRSDNRK